MKKIRSWCSRSTGNEFIKLLRVMKLLFFLMFIGLVQLSATVKAQNTVVNLQLNQTTVAQIIGVLEKKLGKDFFFKKESVDVERKIDVSLVNADMDEVIKQVFGRDFTYSLIDNMIVITPLRQIATPKEKVLEGTVSDRRGELLPGVTVRLKNTALGVTTNADGYFRLVLPETKEVILVFSFVGMQTQEVRVKDEKPIKVVMQEEHIDIDEVVVTGYFNKAKESFTGTATSFSGDELRTVNPVNVLSALAVLDPSFKMVENIADGSNPNVVPQFEVRGGSSMPNVKNEYEGNPNMPTFIMDGFEVTAEKVFDLDPNRIESMTLLKDAAATAIYGSRASNGVVVITTKMPEKGSLRLNYNLDMSFHIPDLRDYDLLNAREKLELEKAAGYYSSIVPNLMEEREAQYNYKRRLIEQGYDTYWLNKPLHVAIGHKHSLNIEGGENSIRYSMDLSYEEAPGVMKESGRERLGVGMMLMYTMKKIIFKNHITYDVVNAHNSPYGSFSIYARANPYYAYEDENGHYLYLLEDDKRGAFEHVPNPLYNTQLHTIDKTIVI